MLDKIINIKPGLLLNKGDGSYSGLNKFFHGGHLNQLIVHDSIRFSPAAHYISKINWQLKELSFSGNEKLSVGFSTGGFEFHTEIDFLKFYINSRLFYDITYVMMVQGINSKTTLRLSVKKDNQFPQEDLQIMNLLGLKSVFGRISALEMAGEINRSDSVVLGELMDGIRDNLAREFEYINTVLFTLIDKIFPDKLSGRLIFPDDNTEPVTIEKIAVIND